MGGGLAFCDGTIQSNLIAGNTSDSQGGAMARCDAIILNNTICDNSAAGDGGGIYSTTGTIANCILWGNAAAGSGNQMSTASTVSFSCVQNWSGGGTGNISDSPLFRNLKAGDYRLQAGSPCIDAGDNSVLTSPGLDMDGKLRIAFGKDSLTVDMGAFEYGSAPFNLASISMEESGNLRFVWNSQPNDTYTLWTCGDLREGDWTIQKKLTIPSGGATTSWSLTLGPEGVKFFRIGVR